MISLAEFIREVSGTWALRSIAVDASIGAATDLYEEAEEIATTNFARALYLKQWADRAVTA